MDKTNGMLRVSQLCKIYNITPRSLERHFMEEIGIPVKELLQIFRINRAIRMLAEEPNANLAGLSYLSGYSDQSHFIKDIKRITGISPGELEPAPYADLVTQVGAHTGYELSGPGVNMGTVNYNGFFDGTSFYAACHVNAFQLVPGPAGTPYEVLVTGPIIFSMSTELQVVD
jgi:AraC-like DNA-binding protein